MDIPEYGFELVAAGVWRTRAACADYDPRLFDTTEDEDDAVGMTESSTIDVNIALAKRICMTCPVNAECRAEADNDDIKTGIWGGETPIERATRNGYRVARIRAGRPTTQTSADLRREARALRESGLTTTAIARRLNVTERSVRRWLSPSGPAADLRNVE